MNNWTPVVLPLSPNPSPRYNHAAAIFPELDIMIVDGGATERHQQSDKTTFILDMKCPSYTGWRWASEVTIGGVDLSLTQERRLHKILPISDRNFIMMCSLGETMGPDFIYGTIGRPKRPSAEHLWQKEIMDELDVPRGRSFNINLTKLVCPVPKSLPNFLIGTQPIYDKDLNMIYWLSPVPENCESNDASLGLYRFQLEIEEKEIYPVGENPPLKCRRTGFLPCTIGHAFGLTGNGLVLYGGASSDRWSRVWEGVHHMVQDPKATNDLYFLQMF